MLFSFALLYRMPYFDYIYYVFLSFSLLCLFGSARSSESGEYAGLVGEYAGLVGEYAGLVGE